MTAKERANALAAILTDELGIPDWQQPIVRDWIEDEMQKAVDAEGRRWQNFRDRDVAAERERCERAVTDAAQAAGFGAAANSPLGMRDAILRRIREGGV